jgi:hypothetical protein
MLKLRTSHHHQPAQHDSIPSDQQTQNPLIKPYNPCNHTTTSSHAPTHTLHLPTSPQTSHTTTIPNHTSSHPSPSHKLPQPSIPSLPPRLHNRYATPCHTSHNTTLPHSPQAKVQKSPEPTICHPSATRLFPRQGAAQTWCWALCCAPQIEDGCVLLRGWVCGVGGLRGCLRT